MSVYRLIFAPTVKVPEYKRETDRYDECRDEIFEKFIEHGFLGTGWDTSCLKPSMSDEDIRGALNLPKGSIENFRCMCSISKDDLIWLMYKSKYYLFKVSKNKIGTNWLSETFGEKTQWFIDRDITTCFVGEWCEVGNEISVPGVVVNCMGIGKTLRVIKKAPELSMMIWNRFTDTDYYMLGSVTEEWFWDMLTNRQKEGLVLTYLQVKYDCIVNTESLKHSTALYECELIAKDGTRYLPQVKTGASGNKEFSVEQYCKDVESVGKQIGHDVIPVLFYENEDYGDYEDYKLLKLYRKDLMAFIQEHPQYVSTDVIDSYKAIESK